MTRTMRWWARVCNAAAQRRPGVRGQARRAEGAAGCAPPLGSCSKPFRMTSVSGLRAPGVSWGGQGGCGVGRTRGRTVEHVTPNDAGAPEVGVAMRRFPRAARGPVRLARHAGQQAAGREMLHLGVHQHRVRVGDDHGREEHRGAADGDVLQRPGSMPFGRQPVGLFALDPIPDQGQYPALQRHPQGAKEHARCRHPHVDGGEVERRGRHRRTAAPLRPRSVSRACSLRVRGSHGLRRRYYPSLRIGERAAGSPCASTTTATLRAPLQRCRSTMRALPRCTQADSERSPEEDLLLELSRVPPLRIRVPLRRLLYPSADARRRARPARACARGIAARHRASAAAPAGCARCTRHPSAVTRASDSARLPIASLLAKPRAHRDEPPRLSL